MTIIKLKKNRKENCISNMKCLIYNVHIYIEICRDMEQLLLMSMMLKKIHL